MTRSTSRLAKRYEDLSYDIERWQEKGIGRFRDYAACTALLRRCSALDTGVANMRTRLRGFRDRTPPTRHTAAAPCLSPVATVQSYGHGYSYPVPQPILPSSAQAHGDNVSLSPDLRSRVPPTDPAEALTTPPAASSESPSCRTQSSTSLDDSHNDAYTTSVEQRLPVSSIRTRGQTQSSVTGQTGEAQSCAPTFFAAFSDRGTVIASVGAGPRAPSVFAVFNATAAAANVGPIQPVINNVVV